MTSERQHGDRANGARRARFDEGDLLAFVEGELDAGRTTEMEAALARNPDVAALVEGMRRDREVLLSIEDEPAPPDLLERVGLALESERGSSAPQPEFIAVQPGVVRVRPSPMRVFLGSRRGRQLAAAAGLLLATGVVGMIAASVISRISIGSTRTPTPGAIARGIDDTPPIVDDAPEPEVIAAHEGDKPTPVTEEPPTEAVAVAEPMTPERAAALLAEGRLAVVIPDVRAGGVAASLARLAEGSDGSGRWRVRGDVPRELAAALLPATRHEIETGPGAPVIAGEDELPTPAFETRTRRGGEASLFLLETPAKLGALSEALEALAGRIGVTPELIELDEPVAAPPSPPDARSVFWWTRPIDEWDRAVVPVVVIPY